MIKKAISLYTIGALLMASCSSTNTSQESCKKDGDLNPNGSSELALLMRKMASHLAANRDALKAGKAFIIPPTEIANLLTAQKTDETLDTTIFNAYARIYQQKTKELISAPDSLKIEKHNNLVSTCRDCHSSFCPGPMVVINQLDIK
jgi:hypothetical protein